MKRIIKMILTIACATAILHTFDVQAISRKQRNQMRQYYLQKKQIQERKSTQRKKSPVVQKKDPIVKKQEAQINQQIKQETKSLEQAVAQQKKATTPEQKAIAQKNIDVLAEELLASVADKRSWEQDIYSGYEKTQMDRAKLAIPKLEGMSKKLTEILEKKEELLARVTDKGWIFNSAKKGKEIEYKALSEEVKKLKDALAKVDRSLRNQRVIAGQEWANAYRALVAAGVIGGGAAAANVALYGSAGIVGQTAIAAKTTIGAGLSSTASWIKEKGGDTSNLAMWTIKFGASTAGALLSLQQAYKAAETVYSLALLAYNTAFGEYNEKNPNATPQERDAALAVEKARADLKAKEDKFNAAVKNAEAQNAK